MLAPMPASSEQGRAVKRLKVDSPSASLECESDSEKDSGHLLHLSVVGPTSADAGSVLSLSRHADAPAAEEVDGISLRATSLENSNLSCHDSDADIDDVSKKYAHDGYLSPPPAVQCTDDTWGATHTSMGLAVTDNSFTTSDVASLVFPATKRNVLTTLRGLGQLQALVSSSNVTHEKNEVHPDLRLKPGETVMLLLHLDDASLRSLTNDTTRQLSQMRIFTLNLAKLPPQDYEAAPGKRVVSGGCTSLHDASDCVRFEGSSRVPGASAAQLTVQESEEEGEEEEELVPSVHHVAVSTTAAAGLNPVPGRECPPGAATSAGGALSLDEATASVSSLSDTLHHASDVISSRLHQILAVDTILNPHTSQQQRGNGGDDGGSASAGTKEPLIFPAMILWRAAGAPREEYPPAPPQNYSTQSSPTPAELFCDRLSAHGGPLVVKEATGVDQVHSLTLFCPVFTMEHLFRTVVRTVAPSLASEERSRTVLYLGASWCPPCMRFVHEMPQFMREDLPRNVVCTLKADMDLAKPIYDCLKIEIIPTFVIFDNAVLMRCYERMQQHPQGNTPALGGVGASSFDYLRTIQDAFSEAELGRLQNSNRRLVSTFISKHSESLCFNEDF